MAKAFGSIDLDQTQAFASLRRLAKRPFDLTRPGALSPGRIDAMRASACGFDLLYATQRVTEQVLDGLQALADEMAAVGQFRQMMRGVRTNRIVGHRCENRQVLHTASRNVFQDLTCTCDAGQADAAAAARRQLARLERFLARLDSGAIANARGEPFTHLVQVGIGGSDLGPRALYLAMPQHHTKRRQVHFLSNVDPDDAAQVLRGLDLSRTLVAVVSKSGTTLETRTNEALVAREFERRGLEPRRHFIAVTAAIEKMGGRRKYLQVFDMHDYIGGRFSATSAVGGLALGFGLGFETFREILRGAREMDLNALEPDIRRNLALLTALLGIWNRNFLGYNTLAILPYSQALIRFVAHLQQLDMESNGKRINRRGKVLRYDTGPVVWGEPGTNGQHAFYQLIHQSRRVIPCEFIGFRKQQLDRDLEVCGTTSQQKFLANLLAQSRALAEGQADPNPNRFFPGNRPNSVLIADRLTPRSLGALLAYYENKVAFQGFLWNINSFDQEGVQLGKSLADTFIGHLKALAAEADYAGAGDPTGLALMQAAGLAPRS